MGFGSDWSVAPLNPFVGIWAAVTRQTSDGKNPNGWFPGQKMSVKQALTAYTAKNAYAGFQEKKWGMIRENLAADLVILEDNILLVPADKIKSVRVYKTLVNGKVAYGSGL
jgi:predicted amidohydrolase YtcJ